MSVILHRNQSRTVRQRRMKCAHRMFHRMFACAGTDHHRVAGHRIGKCHMLPGLQIAAVLYRARQVGSDILDRRKLDHLRHRAVHNREVSFHAVEQRIKPLVCRKFRRYGQHQLRIYHCNHRKQLIHAAAADLLIRCRIGHNAPLIHLGSGSCRCRDRDDRKYLIH